jgi:hypothetical protein
VGGSRLNATHDRVCVNCETGTYMSLPMHTLEICYGFATCGLDPCKIVCPPYKGKYTKENGTATTNRQCQPWSFCGAGEYVAATPNAVNNIKCNNCPTGQYQPVQGNTTIGWELTCDFCPKGYSFTAPNESCSICPNATYQAQNNAASVSCSPWSSTCPIGTYEKSPPTAFADRLCTPLTLCGAGAYESTPPSSTTDRICTPENPSGTADTDKNITVTQPSPSPVPSMEPPNDNDPPSLFDSIVPDVCPKGMYSSFGKCLACQPNQTTTSHDAKSGTDVRGLTIAIFCAALVLIFAITFVVVMFAKRKHGNSLHQGFFSARNFVTYILLTLQTAAYVGPIARVAGDDAITDVHRIIFGVYSVFTLDARTVAPTACSPVQAVRDPGTIPIIALCVTLVLWLPVLVCLCIMHFHCCCSNNTRDYLRHKKIVLFLIKKISGLLRIGYSFVLAIVLSVFVGVSSNIPLVVLSWVVFGTFCLGFPVITFAALIDGTGDGTGGGPDGGPGDGTGDGTSGGPDDAAGGVPPHLITWTKYMNDNELRFQHMHVSLMFFLVLDSQTFALGTTATLQIISTITGTIPCALIVGFITFRMPYQKKYDWMGKVRIGVLIQVCMGYLVKLVGCQYFYAADLSKRPVTLIQTLTYLWLAMYVVNLVLLVVLFAKSLMEKQDEKKELLSVDDSFQNPLCGVELVAKVLGKDKTMDSNVAVALVETSNMNVDTKSGDGDCWDAIVDPLTQRTYYHNRDSKRTTWTNTAGATPEKAVLENSTPQKEDGWAVVNDEKSGKQYYFNRSSGLTQWEKPNESFEAANKMKEKKSRENNDLPGGWEALNDEKSGKQYYINRSSGLTQWECPTNPMAAK